jgi:hypothetical protein
MNTKRFLLASAGVFLSGYSLAATVSNTSVPDGATYPLSTHQQQVLGNKPGRTGEFARFEAVVVKPLADVGGQSVVSPLQLQVLSRETESRK